LLAGVQRLLPAVRVRGYLLDLELQFEFLAEAEVSDLEIAHLAHKIGSQAGMLGLTRMSNCAADLENACRTGKRRQAAVLACRAALDDIRLYAMPAAGVPAS
jgi:HPt (histidine-containing phosphotransfer) domain-containing protein